MDVEDVVEVLKFPRDAGIRTSLVDARDGVKHGAQVSLGCYIAVQMTNTSANCEE